jgi:hypothetical protein
MIVYTNSLNGTPAASGGEEMEGYLLEVIPHDESLEAVIDTPAGTPLFIGAKANAGSGSPNIVAWVGGLESIGTDGYCHVTIPGLENGVLYTVTGMLSDEAPGSP